MEYLVNIQIAWPPDADPARRDEFLVRRSRSAACFALRRAKLFAAEIERGQELAREGIMKRLWRVSGRWAHWGLWEASDATALHAALSSLPLWPWMDVTVHPLAQHVNDPAALDLDAGGHADG